MRIFLTFSAPSAQAVRALRKASQTARKPCPRAFWRTARSRSHEPQTATSSQSTIYAPKPVVHPWDGTAFPWDGTAFPWDGNQIPWDGNQIPWDGSAAARPAPAAATHASPPLPHLKGPKRIVAIFLTFNSLTNSAQNGRRRDYTLVPLKQTPRLSPARRGRRPAAARAARRPRGARPGRTSRRRPRPAPPRRRPDRTTRGAEK